MNVIDLSQRNVDDDYLIKADGDDQLYRLSKTQFLRLFEIVYLSFQVEQWNHTRRHDERVTRLFTPDRTAVTLEDVLPTAIDTASRLFERYTSIPVGGLYTWEQEWEKGVMDKMTILEAAEEYLGPSIFISGKCHEGFVTKDLGFWYDPEGQSFKVADPQIYFDWSFEARRNLVQPAVTSTFHDDCDIVRAEDLRETIARHYQLWDRISRVLVNQRAHKSVRDQIDYSLSQGQVRFDTPEDRESHRQFLVNDERSRIGFSVYKTNSVCRKLGFNPETDKINSAEELLGFIDRFLHGKEEGPKFVDYRKKDKRFL